MATTFTFEHRPKDRELALQEITRRGTRRWLLLAIVVVFSGIGVWMGWSHLPGDPVAALVTALPWFLIGAFWAFMARELQHRSANVLPQLESGGLQQCRVDSEGFHLERDGAALTLPWQNMYRAVETPDLFLFFQSKTRVYYIPKRVMSSGDVEQVRATMKNALNRIEVLA